MERLLYEFASGDSAVVENFIQKDGHMFQVNLPSDEQEYENGNGEGVWAYADETMFNAYSNHETNKIGFVKVLNRSLFYPTLQEETIIPVLLRGTQRPVALLNELQHRFGISRRNEVMRFLSKNKKRRH